MLAILQSIKEYSETCSVHGVAHISRKNHSIFERLFWLFVVLSGFTFAAFFSLEAFLAWREFPLITSVSTTAFPIESLEWPSVTLCSQGRGLGATERIFNNQLENYLKKKGIDIKSLTDAQKEAEERKFLAEKYPGLDENPASMVAAMTSSSPDSAVEAIAMASECVEELTTTTTTPTLDAECNAIGYDLGVEHSEGISCYLLAHNNAQLNFNDYKSYCKGKGGRLLDLTTRAEFLSVIRYLNSTVWLNACKHSGDEFRWKMILARSGAVSQDSLQCSEGELVFSGGSRERNMSWINYNITEDTVEDTFVNRLTPRRKVCLIGKDKTLSSGERYLDVRTAHCEKFSLYKSVCEKTILQSNSNYSESSTEAYTGTNVSDFSNRELLDTENECIKKRKKREGQEVPNIDLYLNPEREKERQQIFEKQKKAFKDSFESMDSISSFPSMFELLWYSGNPCFDVAKFTSDKLHEKSLIKHCVWKGRAINCSQVFTMTPTDKGMCCRFDLKKSKNVFIGNLFTETMEKLQTQDKAFALDTGSEVDAEDSFIINAKPEVGRFKGLTLVLDAHSDLLSKSSVGEDSNGFLIGLTQSGEFPLMSQGTKLLKPGNEHFLGLTAVDTISDPQIQTYLSPEKRKCFYPWEKNLQFHSNYSQSACLFECGISWAKEYSNLSCLPWYFPPLGAGEALAVCDPWDTQIFMEFLRQAPRSECDDCLPDCETTSFSLSSSSALFRGCTVLNQGISNLCKYSSSISPSMTIKHILQEYSHLEEIPRYIEKIREEKVSERVLANGETYEAFKEDIALVHIYWDSPSALQFERALRLTWIDYISQVQVIELL